MSLGNLSFKVSADVGAFTSSMDLAAKSAQSNMGSSADAAEEFRLQLIQTSTDLQKMALSMGSNMKAANDLISQSSAQSAAAIQNISDTADKVDLKSVNEKVAMALGTGVGVGIAAGETAFEKFEDYIKAKAVIAGLAIVTGVTAAAFSAVYATYKVAGMIGGMMDGSFYKSENIDAIIAYNKQIDGLQKSLRISSVEAGALNEALKRLGVDANEYKNVFSDISKSVNENGKELTRLGVAYKDHNGKLMDNKIILQNAKDVLDSYNEGWDRNKAAVAIGIGSYEQIANALKVTTNEVQFSKSRMDEYQLGMTVGAQDMVKKYETTMREFSSENDLMAMGFKRAISDSIMPAYTSMANAFKEGWPSIVSAFRVSLSTITALCYAFVDGVYIVAQAVIATVGIIKDSLAAVGVALSHVMSGDFKGVADAFADGYDKSKDRLKIAGENILAQVLANDEKIKFAIGDDGRSASIESFKKVATPGKAYTSKPEGKGTDPYLTAMDSLGATRAGIDYVNKHFDEYQGKVKESKTAMADFDITLGKFSDKQRALQGYEPLDSKQRSEYIAMNKFIEDGLELERQKSVLRKFDKSSDQFSFSEQQSLDARKQDVEWMGKSQVELAKLTDARRIDAEVAQIIYTTNAELGLKGLKITDDEIAGIYAKADAAKSASAILIQQGYDKQKDPWFGASQAIQKYGDTASNVGAQIENGLTSAFKNAEDAFVQFATTGKISFSSMANSIIADLIRIQARKAIAGLIDQAVGFVSGNFGGPGSGITDNAAPSSGAFTAAGDFGLAGARAGGGPVDYGSSYLVGERGPEIFTPAAGGTIIPNDKIGGGSGGGDIYVSVNADTGASQATGKDGDMRKLGEMIGAKVREVIVTERRNGGLLAS